MRSRRVAMVVGRAAMARLAGCGASSGVSRGDAAAANANVGADFLHKGENDRARQAFAKVLSHDSNNVTAHWGMAAASNRFGEPHKAARYFKKALAIRATPEIENSYAAFLCEQGKTDQGVSYLKRAASAAKGPARATILANAGLCLDRAKRDDEAASCIKRALAAGGTQMTTLTHLARIEYHARHYMKARASIERADAAGTLAPGQLLLGARIELALNDRAAARSYLQRHNANSSATTLSLS